MFAAVFTIFLVAVVVLCVLTLRWAFQQNRLRRSKETTKKS
ncbi:MAG TPA: hypothetical protein VND89_06110 [Acidimicrobiales bacterium]|nr:hypothetical protein [Acidimicrobiales bacterium]